MYSDEGHMDRLLNECEERKRMSVRTETVESCNFILYAGSLFACSIIYINRLSFTLTESGYYYCFI